MFDRRESEEFSLTPEQTALERQLAGLEPVPVRLDRDRLMFEAGRAAERASRSLAATPRVAGAPQWVWPTATALMTAACVVLSAMLVWQSDADMVADNGAPPLIHDEPVAAGQAGEALKFETPTAGDLRKVERLASRSNLMLWKTPSAGYLGMRHVALTRGIGDLPIEPALSRDNSQTRADDDAVKPATAREIFHELVPTAKHSPTNS